MPKEFSEDLC